MPRKDAYHDIVKVALQKDGWQIADDPFLIDFRGTVLFPDLQRVSVGITMSGKLKSL